MLWVKAFHIIFVTSWFAGLFYLPRIYVNLAMEQDPQAQARLLLMAHKLYRFMQPLMLLALARHLALAGLWFQGRLAACQIDASDCADRLSPLLRQTTKTVPRPTKPS